MAGGLGERYLSRDHNAIERDAVLGCESFVPLVQHIAAAARKSGEDFHAFAAVEHDWFRLLCHPHSLPQSALPAKE